MRKKKYEKPTAKDFSAAQIASGSCRSGNIEYTVTDTCENGEAAFIPCNAGGVVLEDNFCNPGSSASLSCWNGSSAA